MLARGTGKGLSDYRSLASCLTWILAASFLTVVWFRYSGPVPVAEDSTFLAGIWSRISEAPLYQLFVAAGAGVIGYGLSVRLALTEGPIAPVARLLGGLPMDVLEEPKSRTTFQSFGKNYALSPLYDAAAIFPGLGFLGTVIGVSIAISGLDAVVETGDTADLMIGLRSAFDTTFFGLTISVVLSILASVVEARSAKIEASDGVALAPEKG